MSDQPDPPDQDKTNPRAVMPVAPDGAEAEAPTEESAQEKTNPRALLADLEPEKTSEFKAPELKPLDKPVVAGVLVERPKDWKPDPGLSRAQSQNDGPLAAVELANFGAPVATDPANPAPLDGLAAETMQMPPHRRNTGARTALPVNAADGNPEAPQRRNTGARTALPVNAADGSPEAPQRRNTAARAALPVTAADGNPETAQLPPHRRNTGARLAVPTDATMELPPRGKGPDAEGLPDTLEMPSHRARAKTDDGDVAAEVEAASAAVAMDRLLTSGIGQDEQEKRKDRMTAIGLLVVGLAMVIGVFTALNKQGEESNRWRGGGPVTQMASVGGHGGGGGGGGKGGASGGAGGAGVGARTKDSDELAVNGTGADACVGRCARRQAACAQTCRGQQKCREHCTDTLYSCENSCSSGAGFMAGDGSSAPAGPTKLTPEQKAEAQKLCKDSEGSLTPCPEQAAKLGQAEAMVQKMCGKDPDFPCPPSQ